MYADTLRFYTRDRLARALALTNGRFSPTKCKSAIYSVQWLHCKSIACTLSDHCCVYTVPSAGGLGLSLLQIGVSLMVVGGVLLPFTLFTYPIVRR